jgi:hypothetical protein
VGKEAGIKLTLNASGFTGGMRAAENEGKRAAGSIGKAFEKAWDSGVKGAGRAITGTLSTIKSTIGAIAPMLGGLSVGALIADSVKGQGEFKKLAFSIRAGTGSVVDYRDMLKEAQAAALASGQSSYDLGAVMNSVFEETGKADFTAKSIKSIATAARAAREPVALLGDIAGKLNKQFGVGADEIDEALAATISASKKGGLSLDEMAEKLGLIGANAKEAGFSGVDGFRHMMGLMNLSKDAMGSLRKGIPVVGNLLDQLGTQAERNKTLIKLGIDPSSLKGADFQKTLGAIMKKTGGNRDKLALAFGAPQLQLLAELGKSYSETFAHTAGDVKTKTAAALAAYDSALETASKSSLSAADVQEEAAAAMQSPAAKMEVALEKLRQAFAKPEITDAIGKLIGTLPGLADIVAKVVGFAVDHPLLAGGAAVGAIGGKGFVEAALPALIMGAFARGGTSAAKSIEGAVASGGVQAGASIGTQIAAGVALFGAAMAVGAAIRHQYNEDQKRIREAELQITDEGGEGTKGGTKHGEDFYTYERDSHGELQTKKSKVRRAVKGLDDIAARFTNPNGEYGQGDPDDPLGMKSGGWDKKPAAAAAPARSALDAKLLADMLASRTLRVEVTNPEAIKGGGGSSGGGTPAPGYAGRP